MIQLLTFSLLFSGLCVVITYNPINSLLFLVCAFINSSILLLILNCEFLAFLFLIVYIGAVIVLFLFIVMMLNIKIIELNAKVIKYLPISFFITILFLIEIFYILNNSLMENFFYKELFFYNIYNLYFIEYHVILNPYFNIISISQLLFTKFLFMFIISGIILLVAMLGAIILTLNQNFFNKQQNIFKQINTEINSSLKLIKINKIK